MRACVCMCVYVCVYVCVCACVCEEVSGRTYNTHIYIYIYYRRDIRVNEQTGEQEETM